MVRIPTLILVLIFSALSMWCGLLVGTTLGSVSYKDRSCFFPRVPTKDENNLTPVLRIEVHEEYEILACKKEAPEGA